MTSDFNELRKNLKKDRSAFKPIRVALISDTSSQLLVQALVGHGVQSNVDFRVFEADIGQLELLVMDERSELYRSDPSYIVIINSAHKLYRKYCGKTNKEDFAAEYIEHLKNLLAEIAKNTSARIILTNLPLLNDAVFGSFANKLKHSWIFQWRKINFHLMELASSNSNLFIADVEALQAVAGRAVAFDPRLKINADMDFAIDFLPQVASCITSVILAAEGNIRKCVIVDLDNTIWGGIIGDDGVERIQIGDFGIGKAFAEMQIWLKQLSERGIILAVCSKNTEHIAKEPFEKHPDMILKLDDIAVFVANWESKSNNIRHIQSVLNIGFDSMVFLDDNPFEREMVKQHIPEITVPDLPEDPSEYLTYLQSLNLFETASFSDEDGGRNKQYREEAKRVDYQKSFHDERGYLESLHMVATVRPFDKFMIPRIAQLSQRSNQFNLRTVRYSEDDVTRIAESGNHFTFSFSLRDKFGDYGLICAVILEAKGTELFIDTWIMSCRVLKRGVENLVMNTIVDLARANGFDKITGEYLPTPKNGIVAGLLDEMGFEKKAQWELSVEGYLNRSSSITAE